MKLLMKDCLDQKKMESVKTITIIQHQIMVMHTSCAKLTKSVYNQVEKKAQNPTKVSKTSTTLVEERWV